MSERRGIPRNDLGPDALLCPTCSMWGFYERSDDQGHLVAHPRRRYPCRVPPGDLPTEFHIWWRHS